MSFTLYLQGLFSQVLSFSVICTLIYYLIYLSVYLFTLLSVLCSITGGLTEINLLETSVVGMLWAAIMISCWGTYLRSQKHGKYIDSLLFLTHNIMDVLSQIFFRHVTMIQEFCHLVLIFLSWLSLFPSHPLPVLSFSLAWESTGYRHY